jgi:AraC-like DNA-binding protein
MSGIFNTKNFPPNKIAPILSQGASMLKFASFHDPLPALKDHLWSLIVLEDMEGEAGRFNYDVVPIGDACLNFVVLNWAVKEKGPAGLSFLLVSGPMSKPARLLVTPKQVLVARFKAGAFQALFGMPPDRAKDKVILLEKFWGDEAKAWADRLRKAPDTTARLSVLAGELACRAQSAPKPDRYAQAAVEMMRASDGRLGLQDLAKRLGYTDRQVERKFHEGLGLNPKEFQRLLRCRLLILRMLNGQFKDWTQLASDFGYSDQAHLIREFKAFMGLPPEKFMRRFKKEGRILEGPLRGIKDEGAMLGYPKDPEAGFSGHFTPLDTEVLIRDSREFGGPDQPHDHC